MMNAGQGAKTLKWKFGYQLNEDEDMKKNINKTIFVLGFLAFWTNGDSFSAAPLLIVLAEDLNIAISSAALTVTAYMLCFGLFTILFGPLGDRFGKTKIIKVAAFGTAIFSILAAFMNDLNSLIAIRAMNGAFASGILPVTMALVGESTNDSERQGAIGKIMGMMFLGGASATVIGGLLAYVGSWRLVYMFYGVAELILALSLLFLLEDSKPKVTEFNIWQAYKSAFSNKQLLSIISIMFVLGFVVLGSFAYTGELVKQITGLKNVLFIGLILSFYGIGTVLGGRISGKFRKKIGYNIFLVAGVFGGLALGSLFYGQFVSQLAVSLFFFGMSFIFFQSTFVTTAQETIPKIRGTVMSLVSFNMVMSGAIGTYVNGKILTYYGAQTIYGIGAVGLLFVGLVAYLVLNRVKTKDVLPELSREKA